MLLSACLCFPWVYLYLALRLALGVNQEIKNCFLDTLKIYPVPGQHTLAGLLIKWTLSHFGLWHWCCAGKFAILCQVMIAEWTRRTQKHHVTNARSYLLDVYIVCASGCLTPEETSVYILCIICIYALNPWSGPSVELVLWDAICLATRRPLVYQRMLNMKSTLFHCRCQLKRFHKYKD